MAEPTGQGTLGHLGSLTTMRLKHGSYSLAGGASGASGGPINVDYLVVAGGGAAGGDGGGGGGAGGMRSTVTNTGGSIGTLESMLTLISGAYTVTVGGGGTWPYSPGSSYSGNKGSNSVFSTITAEGGGGGLHSAPSDQNGGSGGGSSHNPSPISVAGTGQTNQGYGGGQSASSVPSNYPGGGGGGSGNAGAAPSGSVGGNGGNGKTNTIISAAIASALVVGQVSGGQVYWAGGGAGGGRSTGTGSGGLGGGGNSSGTANGTNGTINSGGGGGTTGSGNSAGTGGSGVVIIRYLTASGSATGGTITIDGLYTIHTFTGIGTFTV